MSLDGNGKYSPPAPQYPAIAGTPIVADDFNTIINDIASALSLAVYRDGQAAWTGDQDMGTHKIKNGSIDGAVTAVTQPQGTNTDQIATMKALLTQSFASNLPAQTGNANKVLRTDGTNPAWVDTLLNMVLTSYRKTLIAANSTAAYAIDCSAGNSVNLTLTANTVLSIVNPPPAGLHFTLELTVKQDATGGRTITWPASVTWLGGPAPTIQSAAGSVDTFEMFTLDGGTTWYARHTTPSGLLHVYGAETVQGVKTFSQGLFTASLNSHAIAGSLNKILNGDFRVSQYNGANAVTPTGTAYVIDRWNAGLGQASKLTFQQVADAPAGFKYSLKISVAAQYTPVAADVFSIQQRIEGLNVIDLAFGTANALQVTTSAYIKGSVAGTYAVALTNASRSYVGTVNVTNTWAPIVITIPGDQAGTWATDTGIGLILNFDLGSGSNYSTGTTGAWQAGNYSTTPSCVKFVSQTVGSTLNITGVQLESGSVATPFERVDYGEMLRRCQRYFVSFGGTHVYERFGSVMVNSATAGYASIALPTDMRAAMTVGYSSLAHLGIYSAGATVTPTGISLDAGSPRYPTLGITVSSGLTTGFAGQLIANNTAAARLTFSSEL